MGHYELHTNAERSAKQLRRILVIIGVALLGGILAAVAIYAAAFLMLAPMMQ